MARYVLLSFDRDEDAERVVGHIQDNAVNTAGLELDNDFFPCDVDGVYTDIIAIEGKSV